MWSALREGRAGVRRGRGAAAARGGGAYDDQVTQRSFIVGGGASAKWSSPSSYGLISTSSTRATAASSPRSAASIASCATQLCRTTRGLTYQTADLLPLAEVSITRPASTKIDARQSRVSTSHCAQGESR